jgi:hypothetical protein
MVKSIDMHNFECHKDTHIDWDKGFCVLSGSSAAGKSSIRRGIMWVVNNRPSGIKYINRDCIDEKNAILDKCSVTLTMTDGAVVTRERSPTFNGYFINGKRLEAVGTDVPEEVSKALNFSDVNCQKQFDRPFLIDMSPGDVAKYLNKLVNLEDADIYQAKVEAKKRSNDIELKKTTEQETEISRQLQGYNYLDKAESILKEAENYENITNDIVSKIKAAESITEEYNRINNNLPLYAVGNHAESIIFDIEKLHNNSDKAKYTAISGYITSYTQLKQQQAASEKAPRILQILEILTQMQSDTSTSRLTRAQQLYTSYIENNKQQIETSVYLDIEQAVNKLTTIQTDSALYKNKLEKAENIMQTALQNKNIVLQCTKDMKGIDEILSQIKICPICGNEIKGGCKC